MLHALAVKQTSRSNNNNNNGLNLNNMHTENCTSSAWYPARFFALWSSEIASHFLFQRLSTNEEDGATISPLNSSAKLCFKCVWPFPQLCTHGSMLFMPSDLSSDQELWRWHFTNSSNMWRPETKTEKENGDRKANKAKCYSSQWRRQHILPCRIKGSGILKVK